MPEFRKKPVVIEAWKVRDVLHAAEQNWNNLPSPVVTAYDNGDLLFANYPRRIEIKTLEGWMIGNEDDWLIRGVKRELYPCKPDIFAETYDAVDSGRYVGLDR